MDTRVYLQLESDAAPFLLPGTNHRLTYSAQIGYKNTQGDNSISTHSWGGWQPPTLTFTCLIPWRKPSELEAETKSGEGALRFLRRIHQRSLGEAGKEPVVYLIFHPLSEALALAGVQFYGELQIEPAQDLLAWEVSAQLIAVGGVPARAQERSAGLSVEGQINPDFTAAGAAGASTTEGTAAKAAKGVDKLVLSPFVLKVEEYSGKFLGLFGQDKK